MPFLALDHVKKSLDHLAEDLHPLHVSVLAMLASKVPVARTDDVKDCVVYGSPQEREFLRKWFSPAGGPAGKPLFIPMSPERDGSRWRDEKYSSSTLQRQRDDNSSLWYHPTDTHWGFKPDYVTQLENGFGKKASIKIKNPPFPIAYLVGWFYRQEDIADIPTAVDTLVSELHLDRDGLVGKVFGKGVPSDMASALQATPIDDAALTNLIGVDKAGDAAQQVVVASNSVIQIDQVDTEEAISSRLRQRNVRVDPNLVQAIFQAWMAREIVVLVGAPGTGKTKLGNEMVDALREHIGEDRIVIHRETITPDHDLSAFIGYENLGGKFVESRFTSVIRGAGDKAVAVVLDEWNLSQIDNYFAPVLSSLESGMEMPLPGAFSGAANLPTDIFIIATCNSYLDEPGTRKPLSLPVRRRSQIFQMPNLFVLKVDEFTPQVALEEYGTLLLTQEKKSIQDRFDGGNAAPFDVVRAKAFENLNEYADLPERVRTRLEAIVEVLMERDPARRQFTLGILKDTLVGIVYSGDPDRMEQALMSQIANKIMHTVVTDVQTAKDLLMSCEGADGRDMVAEVVEQINEIARRFPGKLPQLV